MTAFFVCIILIGIFITAAAMIWMTVEKKKSRDYRLEMDERSHDLQQMLEDADQLLDELNHFSDFIVNRMEEKQQDVEAVIQKADERLDLFEQLKDIQTDIPQRDEEYAKGIHEVIAQHKPVASPPAEKRAKIIPFDEKRHEVIKLHKDGLDSTEIARMLSMGKGEIELISKMGR